MAHTDIRADDWIDRWTPSSIRPYLRLARLDRPIGTWLLLFPCWWSLALAAPGLPDLRLMALFAFGAVVMRGAGCTINDIIDRNIDAKVARTRIRPIPSGAVQVWQAGVFLLLQLGAGLLVLLQLPLPAILWGAASLGLVFSYPLMKRVTWWPQAFLGLTFNWGALLGWVAAGQEMAGPPLLLYAAGIVWTLGYDTIYAHQDKADDVQIGVKSTALRLGAASRRWVGGFYGLTLPGLAAAGLAAGHGPGLLFLLLPAAAHLIWQVRAWNPDDPANCLTLFKSNRLFGALVLAALVGSRWLTL